MRSDTTASRCLELVQRHCPRLMREGGGRIESYRKTNKMTQEDIDEIIALKNKNMKPIEIAIETGFSISSVKRHIGPKKQNA